MNRIGVVGLGLIGGSFAFSARDAGHLVMGWDSDAATRTQAAASGLSITADLSGVDLVVLAVPMRALTDGLPSTLDSVQISDTATLTDVGSLKQSVGKAVRAAGLAERYIGGHPMAGTEHNGFSAADAELFRGATWALCLDDDDNRGRIERWLKVADVITDLGAGVIPMTPGEHDDAMAMVSGLPHLLALALSALAAGSGPLIPALAAGSFADVTRVAGSDPALLAAITQQNEPAVRAALQHLFQQLDRPWADLIADGHAARESLGDRREAAVSAGLSHVPASSGQELLRLGQAGLVIQAVDVDNALVSHRRPSEKPALTAAPDWLVPYPRAP